MGVPDPELPLYSTEPYPTARGRLAIGKHGGLDMSEWKWYVKYCSIGLVCGVPVGYAIGKLIQWMF
tara:strand:- start:537 stop:734 length:198 start_codon:yes stop_codon:yes gene_type:complete